MKIRMSIPAALAFVPLAIVGMGGATYAGPYTDALSKCMVDSTTEADKGDLVRWLFASEAQHPEVASLLTITPEQRADMSSRVAVLFERLLTRDCRSQFQDARRNEGEETVSRSFALLARAAMGDLIENPTVSSALASVDSYLDKQKIAAVIDAPPPGTGKDPKDR